MEQVNEMLNQENSIAALHYAAAYGETDVVQAVLAKGIDVNAPDDDGLTALIYAAGRGHSETARLLLQAGADVNVPNQHNVSPLMYTASHGDASLTRLLLAKGADKSLRSKSTGRTALQCAEDAGHMDIAALLQSAA